MFSSYGTTWTVRKLRRRAAHTCSSVEHIERSRVNETLSIQQKFRFEISEISRAHWNVDFLKVLRVSFSVPVLGASALSLAFAAENIKNLPLPLRAREKNWARLVGSKFQLHRPDPSHRAFGYCSCNKIWIQKSATGNNNFVKWKGTFRSNRPKWPDRSKWTTFKAGLEYSGRTKPKWSVLFDVPTEISGILDWMESARSVWSLIFQPLENLVCAVWTEA